MSKPIYPKGIVCFAPKQGAPDFVLADVVISIDQLNDWISENRNLLTTYQDQPQLKLQLLKGDKGPYLKVNNYQKDSTPVPYSERIIDRTEKNDTDDLPF